LFKFLVIIILFLSEHGDISSLCIYGHKLLALVFIRRGMPMTFSLGKGFGGLESIKKLQFDLTESARTVCHVSTLLLCCSFSHPVVSRAWNAAT
jgi:hypothetical protein